MVKIVKGGNAAAAFAEDIENIETIFDSEATVSDRVWAGAELVSEVLPVSIGDAKTVVTWAQRGDDAIGIAKSTRAIRRGGETAATAAGRRAHSNYLEHVAGGVWRAIVDVHR